MRLHHERLRAKGWTDAEIAHAQAAIGRAEDKKHPAYFFLERAVYFGLLFLTLIGVFFVSLVLVPLLLVLETAPLLFLLSILGICFGAFFAILIKDIEWMERRHHALNVLVLLFLAAANVAFIVTRVNGLQRAYDLGVQHDPWLLGVTFAVALVIPYLFHLFAELKIHRPHHAAIDPFETGPSDATRPLTGEQGFGGR